MCVLQALFMWPLHMGPLQCWPHSVTWIDGHQLLSSRIEKGRVAVRFKPGWAKGFSEGSLANQQALLVNFAI